ncbi:hypothetical protein K7432_004400 [Basidiobolus ranarum]|uniref:Tyrosinase copper-binding domain-containing protein n=1 Tax=Basidiobolus ranarum TaxID=34480 RepID=A0ABR2WYC0_9FUNG
MRVIALAVLSISIPLVSSLECSRIHTRREIRQLTVDERNRFIDSILELKKRGEYDAFVIQHNSFFETAHGFAPFFPWHRWFLKRFELALQQIDPKVTIPFWDWSLDSQAPEQSPVFNWFGGNGEGPDSCVLTGPFANWPVAIPEKRCLRRDFDRNTLLSPFMPPEVLNYFIENAQDYRQLHEYIEDVPHNRIHIGIGGEKGDMDMASSANDPIFWIHHAFVDKIWADWQAANDTRSRSYLGLNSDNTRASLEDDLIPFKIQVKDLLPIDTLCYQYSNAPSENFKAPSTADNKESESNHKPPNPTPEPVESTTETEASDEILIDMKKASEVTKLGNFSSNFEFDSLPVHLQKRDIEGAFSYSGEYGGPNPDDRRNRIHLRIPMGLPAWYLEKMNIPVNRARAIERRQAEIISDLNKSGYVSPVALINVEKTSRWYRSRQN